MEETLIRRLLPGKYPQWKGPEMEGSIPSRGTRVHVETAPPYFITPCRSLRYRGAAPLMREKRRNNGKPANT